MTITTPASPPPSPPAPTSPPPPAASTDSGPDRSSEFETVGAEDLRQFIRTGESTPAAKKTTTPASPPPPPPAPPESPEIQLLRQQNAEMKARLAAQPSSPSPAQPTPAAPTPGAPGTPGTPPAAGPSTDEPVFNIQVPDQLMALMLHEDPNQVRQGIATVINATAKIGYAAAFAAAKKYADAEIKKAIDTYRTEITTSTTQATEAENIKKDFFGKYPELNNEIGILLAQTAMAEIIRETGVEAYSPVLREAAAARAKAKAAAVGLNLTAATSPPPPPAPPPTTPTSATSRGSNGRSTSGPLDDLFFGLGPPTGAAN